MRAKICEKIAIAGWGGFLENPHGYLGGKSKNHGGQKWSKNRRHGLWMPPY